MWEASLDEYLCLTLLAQAGESETDFKARLSAFWTRMLRERRSEFEQVYAEVRFQHRRHVRLEPRVDHQRPATTPMLVSHERTPASHVGRRVRAGERDPQEVVQVPRGELAVVDDYHERDRVEY